MIKENICSYHEDIKLLAKRIKKSTDLNEINQYADEIYKLTKLAKTAGQHMENRMRVVREHIEEIGFVRKKKKKYNKANKKIMKEILVEALSKPSEEAIKQNNKDSELLNKLRK
jgi:endonuclease III